jgi:hypothetical protein
MAKPRRSKARASGVRRRVLALMIAVAAGVGLLGFAYAQSNTSFSLNSPVSFPVDI